MIVDTHAHVGDVLWGRNITFRQNVVKRDHHNYLEKLEENDNLPYPEFLEMLEKDKESLLEAVLNEEQARNNIATLENLQASLDENKVDKVWVLPIVPRVPFEEVLAASKLDDRIVPFTGIDFMLGEKAADKALADVAHGARGLKVHPILQQEEMDNEIVISVLEAWKKTGLPVIFHTYSYEYYHPEQGYRNSPENGSNPKFVELAARFPELTMIAAHAGGPFLFDEIIEGKDLPNLYVDTSFQTEEVIRKFLKEFGPERVLLGSDWPWGYEGVAIRLARKACGDDAGVMEQLMYKNAQRISKGDES
jgi:hypothetical protein